jgi:signal transduction histidine kinase/HAMP domain-containing protein
MIKQAWNKLVKFIMEFNYRSLRNMGIGKTLLLWFLAIALIPLTILSFINFLYYYQGLNVMAKKSLFTTSQLRLNYLTSYIQDMSDYLNDISHDPGTLYLFESLEKVNSSNNSNTETPVNPNAQKQIDVLREGLLKTYMPEGINDIYFINTEGIILFELNSSSELGSNIFAPPLSSSTFSKTAKKILSNGNQLFSDLEIYPPSGTELFGFLGQPIYAQNGAKIGILAIQINTEKIDKIIQYGIGFGNSGHVYLVGLDLKLRSASKIEGKSRVLIDSGANTKTRVWQSVKLNNVILAPDGKPITEEVSIYQSSNGTYVMGLYRNIEVLEKLGVHWALVEEIDQDEAHVVARELSTFAKMSLILTTIIVVILSLIVTRKFVYPIKRISEWAKQVAHGELVSKDIQVAENEVGEMKNTFNWLVQSLQSFAEVSQSVALGDYSKTVKVRSDKDTMAISMNEMVESFKNVVKQAKSIASGDYSTNIKPRSDQDTLGIALYEMTMKLREAHIEIMGQDWLKTGLNELGLKISGESSINELSDEVIKFLSRYLNAQLGFLFLKDDNNQLRLSASFAGSPGSLDKKTFSIGEGLIGQAARERKTITFFSSEFEGPKVDIGPDLIQPHHFIISPILFEGQLIGVIELASFEAFEEQKQSFLQASLDNISVAINTARSRERVQELLSKTQEQANELVMQKEELRQINQELEEQTKALKLSEESLQHQQEELRVINEELEERTKVLELQRDDIRKKNDALEQAQQEIRHKAEALEIASRYKSEFLANMSHELRTPLNSILVLSEILALNKHGVMTNEEVEFAGVINSSGKDLLDLINDILDLSKVEAGKFEIDIEEMNLSELEDYVNRSFSQLVKKKNITLTTKVENGLPEYIMTDTQRVMQIVKNLMSNAIKFTEKGGVTLHVCSPAEGARFNRPELTTKNCIAIEVSDSGIGISEETMKVIFEAFQQADGTISRKFGGTGLGLTISRSLARLLGGEIQLKSKVNVGSTFTLYLPYNMEINLVSETKTDDAKIISSEFNPGLSTQNEQKSQKHQKHYFPEEVELTTSSFLPDTVFDGKKILIIDDDMRNVFVLSKILEEKNVNIIVGRNGREGLEKLMSNPDTNLVLMDIMMPEMDGYTAMREIRKDSRFVQLPIIALTAKAMKGDREKCIEAGANDYMSKPVQTEKLLTLLRVWLHK